MVLLESLADEFRITLTILSEEDFERFCFGRHICLNPNLSTYFHRATGFEESGNVPGTRPKTAAES